MAVVLFTVRANIFADNLYGNVIPIKAAVRNICRHKKKLRHRIKNQAERAATVFSTRGLRALPSNQRAISTMS